MKVEMNVIFLYVDLRYINFFYQVTFYPIQTKISKSKFACVPVSACAYMYVKERERDNPCMPTQSIARAGPW